MAFLMVIFPLPVTKYLIVSGVGNNISCLDELVMQFIRLSQSRKRLNQEQLACSPKV